MSTLAEKIAVMQAFERGEKIEVTGHGYEWSTSTVPVLNWSDCDYRIAKPEPKKIKLRGWYNGFELRLFNKNHNPTGTDWQRVPSEDKEITLP